MGEVKKILSNPTADIYFLPGTSAAAFLPKGHKQPVQSLINQTGPYAFWGNNSNSLPKEVELDIRKTPPLSTGIWWMVKALVSGGIVYGTIKIDANGQEKFIPVRDLEIEKWNKSTNINKFVREAPLEFYKFWNGFARMSLNENKTFIPRIECMETMFCRLAIQDQNTGAIKTCFVHADMNEDQITEKSKHLQKYPVIDPYFEREEQVRNISASEFIYPFSGPSSGDIYYARAPWYSARESGWVAVAQMIPDFKKALLENQYTIKYHFILSDLYWNFKYPDWEKLTEEEKSKLQQKTLEDLDKKFRGKDRAGNSLLSIAATNPMTKETYPGLEIVAVDDKIKSGIYIEDSQEATNQLYTALGLDGTMIGPIPTSGQRSGSGSDKRVAYNIYISNSKPEQDIILEPIQFAYDFNGFSKKYEKDGGLVVWFRNYWITTLDKGKEKQQETA